MTNPNEVTKVVRIDPESKYVIVLPENKLTQEAVSKVMAALEYQLSEWMASDKTFFITNGVKLVKAK